MTDSDPPTRQVPEDDVGPLAGLRVVELGQLLAGPFCATVLGYFGAEVVKVEPLAGDPIRKWRALDPTGTSYWWYSLARNKRCVTLDLKQEAGRELARRLIERADVLVENFRPGTLERWGLGPDELRATNPELVVARISGYGQTGPKLRQPGYASVCEGFGGLRYVNGHPGERPVRPNLSIGDTLAGLHAAIGVLMGLIRRGWRPADSGENETVSGQDVDVAIFEAVYNLMEGVVPEYSGGGLVREPSGSTITGIVPTNTYATRDGKWLIIGGNGEAIFQRLMRAAGRPDMAEDPRFAGNEKRVRHEEEIDRVLADWTATLTLEEAIAALAEAEVPGGPIYSVREMMEDPHYRARGLFETVETAAGPLEIPAIVPRLTATPGRTEWPGPALGEHNHEVYCGLLGLGEVELEALRARGVV
ncbi:MAG TPA: CoA transferase [Thermoanaerobaculia bacterium]|nr:CoA transferase [Thermoanaerobaculia bacterium]